VATKGSAWTSEVGSPRNNQIFFRFVPKQTEIQSVSVVFRFVSRNQKQFFRFFRFVSVCFGVSDRYRNKRNKQNFVETNRSKQKNLQKTFSIRWSWKLLIFFLSSNRNSICFGWFSVCFFAKPKRFFSVCFGVSDRYRNNRNKQNLWYREF
jgi:hypothetical protein